MRLKELHEELAGSRDAWEVPEISFKKLVLMDRDSNFADGIVLMGAGGDLNKWIDGIVDMWNDEGITQNKMDLSKLHADPDAKEVLKAKQPEIVKYSPSELLNGAFSMKTSGGRTDLVLLFKPNAPLNIGKLALWRLKFGDCSWISDYVVNYRNQHKR